MTHTESPELATDAELLPCPFCGGQAEMAHSYVGSPRYEHATRIRCDGCDIELIGRDYNLKKNAEEKAIAAWNRRARLAAAERRTEAVAIRPLEWKEHEHSSQGLTMADDGFGHRYWVYSGTYNAPHSPVWNMGVRPLRSPRDNDQKCDSLEAAKAAAQADFDQRILSALVLS